MKLTLLQIVQDIMSDMESDEVNDIADTVEALEVAQIVKSTYEALIVSIDVPTHTRLIQLESLADTVRPNYLKITDPVREIYWVKYDNQTDGETDYVNVTYMEPHEFVLYTSRLHENRQEVTDFSGVRLWCSTNSNPKYYTTFDDEHLVFDAYNSSQDTTLQQSKVLAFGHVFPAFMMQNDFVPDLPNHMHPLLLSKAKSRCFTKLKQMPDAEEQTDARRLLTRNQVNQWQVRRRDFSDVPNYGRRRR